MKLNLTILILFGTALAADSEVLPEFDGNVEELVAAGDGNSRSLSAEAEAVCYPNYPYLCPSGFCCPYSTCCDLECCLPEATYCSAGLCYR